MGWENARVPLELGGVRGQPPTLPEGGTGPVSVQGWCSQSCGSTREFLLGGGRSRDLMNSICSIHSQPFVGGCFGLKGPGGKVRPEESGCPAGRSWV